MSASDTLSQPAPRPPMVKGLPLIGSTLEMAKNPARFFVRCYHDYGPAFRVRVFGNTLTVIAGAEAATFMGTREGKESLRSKEAWEPLMQEFGASKMLTAEDGDLHKQLRTVMKRGFSKDSIKGRYNEILKITEESLLRDWLPGNEVGVVQAMQYLVVDQLGSVLTGSVPRAYVKDIRTTILYILNVLVTRQRPKFLMHLPEYKRAKKRMFELGRQMVADYHARPGDTPDEFKTLIDDVMEAHQNDPALIPDSDLVMLMTSPYVAGLDTVANTTAAIVYTVLKHPDVLKRVHEEVDALFAKGPVNEETFMKDLPVLNGAIMETMRLYPIAVAQIRTAAKDFVFQGYQIKEGEMIYLGTSVPHFLEEFYPNPDTFDVDRYSKERAEHMQIGSYSPYGRGHHTCLGKSLAEVLLAMTMAEVFYKLDFELESPHYVLKTKTAPTPGPAMNFKVRVKGYRH
ncbi:cytochrome P450 [Sinimarinibacterium sp. CAU 1509]|uniref:cytochrome P450 n=1 Tax=Sinimarinibacterium sp. CAU 1509 TaxID=2562283 RepID=UPI0010ACBE37|nr:cytochrome P450 [Sinimarinibacterium sp. CAU 1509]TJY58912.1 cytochrome P450 [Sinimarinibacterium sp. CAU 1509]